MKKTNSTHHEKRQKRKNETSEDFTPKSLVLKMVDELPIGFFTCETKTFLDPACGNGNILVVVLQKKLDKKHNPLKAIQSIYGCDIMQDNIKECRLRLLKVLQINGIKITEETIKAVFTNIICTPLNKYPNGSLDYDFSFKTTESLRTVREWHKHINKWLENVDVENGIVGNLEFEEVIDKQEESDITDQENQCEFYLCPNIDLPEIRLSNSMSETRTFDFHELNHELDSMFD